MGGGKKSEPIINAVFNGAGHMWFLPMLFWCFIISWILMSQDSPKHIIIVCVMFYLLPHIEFPLQISTSFEYIIFFVIGYYMLRLKDVISKYTDYKYIIIIWILFVIMFVISTYVVEYLISIQPNLGWVGKFINIEVRKITIFIYQILGIASVYTSCLCLLRMYLISDQVIRIGSMCMGVYLFQQFILKYLYYKSTLLTSIPCDEMPFLAFFTTMILSLALTKIMRLTKIGRILV